MRGTVDVSEVAEEWRCGVSISRLFDYIVISLFILWAYSSGLAAQQFGKPEPTLETVSLVSLIASPKDYEGRRVRVQGPGYFSEEGDGVCLSKSDIEGSIAINCVSIVLDLEKLGANRATLEGRGDVFVVVEGAFDSGYRGLYGATSGSINRVSRLLLYNREESTRSTENETR